jgi:hypothetical protein
LADFSIEMKGVNFEIEDDQLSFMKIAQFIKDLRKVLSKKKVQDVSITKFKVPDNIKKIGLQERKKEIYN